MTKRIKKIEINGSKLILYYRVERDGFVKPPVHWKEKSKNLYNKKFDKVLWSWEGFGLAIKGNNVYQFDGRKDTYDLISRKKFNDILRDIFSGPYSNTITKNSIVIIKKD